MSILQVSTPEQIKRKHSVRLHQLPSGLVVEIAKVNAANFLKAAGIIPIDFKFPKAEELQAMSEEDRNTVVAKYESFFKDGHQNWMQDEDMQASATEYLLTQGVSNPKVVVKPLDEVADDEVHVSHFDEDLDDLVEAIIDFSGFKTQEGLMELGLK
jgi:hypothetical protein